MPNYNINTCILQELKSSFILYRDKQVVKPNSWNGKVLLLFLFGTIELLDIDSKNISTLLIWIANFIWNKKLADNIEKNILALSGFGQAALSFVSSIYEVG